MEHDPPGRDGDPGAELDEALAERADLAGGAGGAGQVPTQFLEQDVGGGGEQHSEGISLEPGATRPVQPEPVSNELEARLYDCF